MGWVIYISGFILTYLFCKWLRGKNNDNTWGTLVQHYLYQYSVGGAIIVMAVALGVIVLVETIKVKNPPKWL